MPVRRDDDGDGGWLAGWQVRRDRDDEDDRRWSQVKFTPAAARQEYARI